MSYFTDADGDIRHGRVIVTIALSFLASVLVFSSFTLVPAGARGVLLSFGATQERILGEGLNFKIPFVQRVVKIDVKTQKNEVDAGAASKDLQNVTARLALNYHIQPESVGKLYQSIGLDYQARIIDPAIQEAIKSVTSKFTAEELITRRQEVKDQAKIVLVERLSKQFIVVDDLSIVNFSFSNSFDQAIEAKVTAEQNALAARNKLEQVKFEAQQKIETAKADAESIRIQAQALAQNQELVKLKAVEKWNGVLPTTMLPGSTVPFLDLK
jgi:regulator of protease activity HflC (stomatin/prohibitin superfamily)